MKLSDMDSCNLDLLWHKHCKCQTETAHSFLESHFSMDKGYF